MLYVAIIVFFIIGLIFIVVFLIFIVKSIFIFFVFIIIQLTFISIFSKSLFISPWLISISIPLISNSKAVFSPYLENALIFLFKFPPQSFSFSLKLPSNSLSLFLKPSQKPIISAFNFISYFFNSIIFFISILLRLRNFVILLSRGLLKNLIAVEVTPLFYCDLWPCLPFFIFFDV